MSLEPPADGVCPRSARELREALGKAVDRRKRLTVTEYRDESGWKGAGIDDEGPGWQVMGP